jgi:hypothetical protein
LRPGASAQGVKRGVACRRKVGGATSIGARRPRIHRRRTRRGRTCRHQRSGFRTATAQPAPPASLEEATRAIDLRKFPLADGGKDLYNSAAVGEPRSGKDLYKRARALSYVLRRSGGAQVAQFNRTRLADAGWKLSDAPASKDYFEFTGFKQGFLLSGSVYENRAAGELGVSITNHGNIDSRTLPRLAMTELKDNNVLRTIYLTDARPDAVLEFMRAELKKGGWREVRDQTGTIDMEPGFPVILRFIQRGIEITNSVEGKNGKTEVWNQVRLLDVELPIMPEAQGVVQFLGDSDHVHLFYALPATGPEKVLDFYHQELPALGWTMRAGTDKIEGGKAKVTLDAPERLAALGAARGQTGHRRAHRRRPAELSSVGAAASSRTWTFTSCSLVAP